MATIPVISPEGQFGHLPPENVEAGLARGFRHAVAVVSPEGQDGWLPAENVAPALKRGFKVGTSAQLAAENPDNDPNSNFLSRFAARHPLVREAAQGYSSNVGLPETAHASDFSLVPGLTQEATHPIQSAKDVVASTFSPNIDALKTSRSSLDNAAQVLTDKNLPLATRAKGAISNLALGEIQKAAGLVPVLGPAAYQAAEEAGTGIASGNKEKAAHGIGSALGVLTTAGAMHPEAAPIIDKAIQTTAKPVIATSKAIAGRTAEAVQNVKQVINPVKYMTAEQAATKAIRPRNAKANFPQELQTALPDARRAADTLGIDPKSMTLEDAANAITQAKKDVWGEYKNNYSDPNADVTVDTSPVADAMRKTISQRMREQNPALAKQTLRNAGSYDGRDLSVQELESRVQELNNQTRSIEARYIADKRAAKLNPKNAALFAERDTLRKLLLDKMGETAPDFAGDNPEATAAGLRQRYGNLMSVEDALGRRLPVANRQAPKTLPDILSDIYGPAQIAKGVAQMATGVGAVHGLANVVEGTVGMKMAKNAKLLNDPNYLVSQAFQKTKAREPMVLRKIINGEYMPNEGDASAFTPGYQGKQLPSGQPRVDKLTSGQYEAQPSALERLVLQRQPQLQKAPTVGPSRQLPAKGSIALGPSGTTGVKNIEPVGLPSTSGGIASPEGQAVANAVTKGAKPREFTEKRSDHPLPWMRTNNTQEAPSPIQANIEKAGGKFLGTSAGIAMFNVPELGPRSSTLAVPVFATADDVAAHIKAALADAKNRPSAAGDRFWWRRK